MCGGPKWVGFVSGSKFTWRLCRGIEFELILDGDWLDFRVGVELYLGFCMGSEIALVLVRGSKLTWFLCGRSRLTCFCVRAENDLVSVYGSKLTWAWCRGRNWFVFLYGLKGLVFSVGIDWVVFVWVVEIDLVFMSGHRNGHWLSFRVFFIALARGVKFYIKF